MYDDLIELFVKKFAENNIGVSVSGNDMIFIPFIGNIFIDEESIIITLNGIEYDHINYEDMDVDDIVKKLSSGSFSEHDLYFKPLTKAQLKDMVGDFPEGLIQEIKPW